MYTRMLWKYGGICFDGCHTHPFCAAPECKVECWSQTLMSIWPKINSSYMANGDAALGHSFPCKMLRLFCVKGKKFGSSDGYETREEEQGTRKCVRKQRYMMALFGFVLFFLSTRETTATASSTTKCTQTYFKFPIKMYVLQPTYCNVTVQWMRQRAASSQAGTIFTGQLLCCHVYRWMFSVCSTYCFGWASGSRLYFYWKIFIEMVTFCLTFIFVCSYLFFSV